MSAKSFGTATVLLFSLERGAAAQQRDTTQAMQLDALLVTAERSATLVRNSIGAVTQITARDLLRRPVRTLAEAVQHAPGIVFFDFEGTGADPQLLTRGFYGGGEADYVLLLLDGQPINNVETGRINWDLIPLASVQSIEIVRGPASAAWGDAALGGVINVITRRANGPAWRGSLSGGANGVLRAAASGFGALGGRPVSAFGSVSSSNGFRDHAERRNGGVSGTLGLTGTAERGFSLSTYHDWRSFDEPGPLTTSELASSREQSSPFHRFDRSEDRVHQIVLDARNKSDRGQVRGALSAEYRSSHRIRTLRLSPDFGDTNARRLTTRRLLASLGTERSGVLTSNDALVLGIDAAHARLDSDFSPIGQGDLASYVAASGSPDWGYAIPGARVAGSRSNAAGFGQYALQPVPALRLTLGARGDWLRDAFEPAGAEAQSKSYLVLSERLGLNYRYASQGNVYASAGRSFKAPTPDQLYDQRRVPAPFDPFQVTFSNFELEPQRGINYEAGVYQTASLIPDALAADITVSVYQLDMKDEVDFDVNTLSYRNIGRSRHRGAEIGISLRSPSAVSAFANYTLQSVTSRTGENSGNYLKAIPRHFLVGGITAGHSSGISGSLVATSAREMYLDDANTEKLPDWTRLDARLAYAFGAVQLTADLYILAGSTFSTTGFPDPAGTGQVYYYPAAGRTLHLGLTVRR
ncbi:MAG: TonB-dependent receptor [Pseudomonas sp.]